MNIVRGVILFILLIATVYIECTGRLFKRDTEDQSDDVCSTANCYSDSQAIYRRLNMMIPACDNFFLFSCGSYFMRENGLSDMENLQERISQIIHDELLSQPISSNDTESIQNVKILFNSCMNKDQDFFTHIRDFLDDKLNGWPLMDENYAVTLNGTYDKLVALFSIGLNPFFRMDVDVNPFETSNHSIWIKKPVSIRFKKHQIIETNLKVLLRRLILQLNSSTNTSEEQINGVIRLENLFNLINKKSKYNPPLTNMTINELAQKLPKFDWENFIVNRTLKSLFNISIDVNQTIIIQDFEYLKKSIEVFDNETSQSSKDLDNFFIWEMLKTIIQYFPNNEPNSNRTSVTNDNKTMQVCSRFVTANMNFLVAKYFINKNFNDYWTQDIIQMVENIRLEYKEMISENDWMDDDSKAKAIRKLNRMVFKIGYPTYILNDTLMNEVYKSLKFKPDNFVENDFMFKSIMNQANFYNLLNEVNMELWRFGPAFANAAYFTLLNEIYLPAGIIQYPFYSNETLKVINYAKLGSIIGHEMAHAFDSEGRKFDHKGRFHPDNQSHWNFSSVLKYYQKSDCFINHYSNYTISNLAQKHNGIQTLEENISDILGFKASLRAYKRWVAKNGPEKYLPFIKITHDQLFFIAYAQTQCELDTFKFVFEQNHSPNHIRLYGVVANTIEFANSFNCSNGSFHNYEEKCSIWK